jgi:transposase
MRNKTDRNDARRIAHSYEYLKLDNEIKAIVRTDPVCQRLMTVPRIGAVTAPTFKAAVDDPRRFKLDSPPPPFNSAFG